MTALPQHRMTVDEFLAWAEGQEGRYELYHGVVYPMGPARARHAEVKFAVQTALSNAIRRAGLPCHMLPDGMTVRVAEDTAHEPDALVYCGEEVPGSVLEIPNPVIVVEVLSPSTRRIDAAAKFAGYFSLPSVMHYLIVDPDKPLVIHHARAEPAQAGGDGSTIASRILRDGRIRLDPPGMEVTVGEIYGAEAG